MLQAIAAKKANMAPPQAKPTKKTDNLWQQRATYPPATPRPIDKSKSINI